MIQKTTVEQKIYSNRSSMSLIYLKLKKLSIVSDFINARRMVWFATFFVFNGKGVQRGKPHTVCMHGQIEQGVLCVPICLILLGTKDDKTYR